MAVVDALVAMSGRLFEVAGSHHHDAIAVIFTILGGAILLTNRRFSQPLARQAVLVRRRR